MGNVNMSRIAHKTNKSGEILKGDVNKKSNKPSSKHTTHTKNGNSSEKSDKKLKLKKKKKKKNKIATSSVDVTVASSVRRISHDEVIELDEDDVVNTSVALVTHKTLEDKDNTNKTGNSDNCGASCDAHESQEKNETNETIKFKDLAKWPFKKTKLGKIRRENWNKIVTDILAEHAGEAEREAEELHVQISKLLNERDELLERLKEIRVDVARLHAKL